jgi:hypothetical protein
MFQCSPDAGSDFAPKSKFATEPELERRQIQVPEHLGVERS